MEKGASHFQKQNTIKVNVKFAGRSIPLDISLDSKIKDLKSLLQPLTNVLPRGQKLICKGKILVDEMTLRASEVNHGAKIMLMASQGLHQGAIPGEVWACGSSARVLDLNHNSLHDVPAAISCLSSLQKLLLNANGLLDESINWEGLVKLKSLTIVSLNQNHLMTLPSSIGVLTCLRQLHIANNKLTSLPPEIGLLTGLEVLEANNNRISCIPESIGECISLIEVDLSSNLLEELPGTFGELKNLKALYLCNNGLKGLPGTLFKNCTQLSALDLHGTEITTDLLRKFEGWDTFDERRRLKHQKQLDFRVTSSTAFDEGADTN